MFMSVDGFSLCLIRGASDPAATRSADALMLLADAAGYTLLQSKLRYLQGGRMAAGPEFTCLSSQR